MSDTGFYRAFEDRYRGSRELIKDRLRVYLPLIAPLRDIYPECPVIDLGCGRGEWLELTSEAGFSAQGVDIDDDMLASCLKRGLTVATGDAIDALKALPDESQTVVSGFHFAEHLPFELLQTLVKEALRVLKPAGLLILETPNPENLVVGTSNFYLDPSHQRPLPPPLLAFLPEHYGFFRTKIIRLQEISGLAESSAVRLDQVLSGVSPDFAILAQKNGTRDQLGRFDTVLKKEYGLTLEALAERYDAKVQGQFAAIAQQIARIEAQVRQAEASTREAEARTLQAETKTQEAEARTQQAETKTQEAEARTQQALAALTAIQLSSSWRITYPIRYTLDHLKGFARIAGQFISHPKQSSKKLLIKSGRLAISSPRLKPLAFAVINRFPETKARLKGIILEKVEFSTPPTDISELSERARTIYEELKRVMKSNG